MKCASALIGVTVMATTALGSNQAAARTETVAIPEQFYGTWVSEPDHCQNVALDPPTIITAQGLRREEIWGTPIRIESMSADGARLHLVMGYQFETVEAYLYDSQWSLDPSGVELRIVETSLSKDQEQELERHDYRFVRC